MAGVSGPLIQHVPRRPWGSIPPSRRANRERSSSPPTRRARESAAPGDADVPRPPACAQSLRDRFGRERVAEIVRPDIGADQDALGPLQTTRGVPDLGGIAAGPGNTPVDLLIQFPKAPRGLERDLAGGHVVDGRHRRADRRREVRIHIAQRGERYSNDNAGRIDPMFRASPGMLPDDTNTRVGTAQPGHHRPIGDHTPQRASERLAYATHAAHRLQHGRRHGGEFAELHRPLPEIRCQDLPEIQRMMRRAGIRRAGFLRPAGARRPAIGQILVERAETPQERTPTVLVLGADRLRQQILFHGLRRQFGDVAAGIVHHSPVELRRPIEGMVVLHQRGAVVVAHHLQRDAERAAVREDTLVMVGQPSRAGIEIQVLVVIPRDVLGAAGLDDRVAAAQGPVAAAGTGARLQDQRPLAGVTQFVGQHHASDPGADDHHAPPRARGQRRRLGIGLRHRLQSHRGHGVIGSRHTAPPCRPD
jgi:hypothetical protein